LSHFADVGSLVEAVPRSSAPCIKRGKRLFRPVPKVACRWLTVVKSCELYIVTVLATWLCPEREEDGAARTCTGFPRASDLNSRVLEVYSFLQDDIAFRRVKERFSEWKASTPTSSLRCSAVSDSASGPGKKREKAALQACGEVTSSWKRRDTSATEARSEGARWDIA